jgi:hypothetical protein
MPFNKMQHPHPSHASSTSWWHPPQHVAKSLIMHAIRNIPNNHVLMEKCYPQKKPLTQLKPHVYNSGGKLQWNFG